MARLDYVDPETFPSDKRSLLDTLSNVDATPSVEHSLEGGTLNVYRALGRNLALLEGFRTYAGVVWHQGGLSPHERELVILATAYHADSAYEWHQHVRVALDEGVPPEHVLAISREEHDHLPDEYQSLVAYVARFVAGQVDDATHDALADDYDDETILGVGMLSGLYLGLAHVIAAIEVDFESDFVGWDLERL